MTNPELLSLGLRIEGKDLPEANISQRLKSDHGDATASFADGL